MAPRTSRDAVVHEVLGLLRDSNRAVQSLAAQFAAQAAVHPTDLNALEQLSRCGGAAPTVGELGLALELSSAAVTGLVDRLEAAGHVERFRDADDGRRVRVRMTATAHELAGEVFGSYAARLRAAMGEFTVDQLRTVSAFLLAATEAAERSSRTRPDVP